MDVRYPSAANAKPSLLKTTLYGAGAGVCLAVGCYALLGLVQALLVFAGERMASNVRLWLPVAVFFLGFGTWLGLQTLRLALQRTEHR